MKEILLDIKGLTVDYRSDSKVIRAVDNIDLSIYNDEVLGIVGESGSGKTTLAMSILNLIASPGKISNGEIIFKGIDILSLDEEALNRFRWEKVSIVFQAAQNILNPVTRIAEQLNDIVLAHPNIQINIREKVFELFKLVKLDPERVLNAYPHQLSGGMKQRVAIVMALMLDPLLLILDEPTTALDVLTQKQILDTLKEIHRTKNMAMLLITHDLSIVAEIAERVAIMYAGKIVELASINDIFYNPQHPYTKGLLNAVPSIIGEIDNLISIPGSPPDLSNLPRGCRFSDRCQFVRDLCQEKQPSLLEIYPNHFVACYRWREIDGE